MGIGTTIASKIGIPLAIVALASFLLYSFRSQITTTIKGGAGVLGEAVTTPIGGFLQGIQKGFQQVPSVITIPFPELRFMFGMDKPVFGSPECDPRHPELCAPAEMGMEPPFISDPTKFLPPMDKNRVMDIPKSMLDPSFRFRVLGETFTRGQIIEQTGKGEQFESVIGLFDLPQTKTVEFIGLSQSGIDYYKSIGINPRLSGQLF